MEKINQNGQSMLWYNFWKYFRFPLSILLSVTNVFGIVFYLDNIVFTWQTILLLIIELLSFIYMCVTYAFFCIRKSQSYNIFITYLILIELLCTPFMRIISKYASIASLNFQDIISESVLTIVIWGVIWILPNYIYFKKRRNYFYNDAYIFKHVNEKKQETYKKEITWNEYLNNNFKSTGTRTNLQEIRNDVSGYTKIPNTIIEDNGVKKKISDYKITIYSLIIVICIETIAILGFGIYSYSKNSKLNQKNTQIGTLKENAENNADSFYKILYNSQKSKIEFMDEYVVIVPENTNIYHKYDCKYLDISNFLVFNLENAQAQGYVACKHCIK